MHHGGLVYAAIYAETSSPGLRQDGTKDLETEGGRKSSRILAPKTKKVLASTRFSSTIGLATTAGR
jgi:hypothetical protein